MILLTRPWRLRKGTMALRVGFLVLALAITAPTSTFAAEPAPGDSCAGMAAGTRTEAGGPEVAGSGYMLVCDGTTWKSVLDYTVSSGRANINIGNDTGGCTAAKTGRIRYDDSDDKWEYCKGSDPWLPFEQAGSAGLSGPADCPNIGDLCADGTVFAGYHPITQEHLFIPTTDQEKPGSPGTFYMNWKISAGTNDISPDSTNDGQVNHANRSGAIANFQAFRACEDLSAGGHGDWYLPSQVELYYLWALHETIEAGGNITNFDTTDYWSSTDNINTSYAWAHSFFNGVQNTFGKIVGKRVRCVRR